MQFPCLKSFNSSPQLSRIKFKLFHLVYKAFCDPISFYVFSFIVCLSFIFTLCSGHTEQFIVLCSFPENQTTFQDNSPTVCLRCTIPLPQHTVHLHPSIAMCHGLWFVTFWGQAPCLSQIRISRTCRCLLNRWVKEGISKYYQYLWGIIVRVFFTQKWSWLMLVD